MATWDFIQKQILLGDASTGKSSLLVRLTDDRFLQHSEPTIGVEFGSRLVDVCEDGTADDPVASGKEKKVVKLQIWDTAGQESFRSITRSYYRGAFGALLIFSLSSRSSFLSCQSWLEDLRTWGEEGVVILLVGNKGDFKDGEREVGEEEAREWAAERGLVGYTECSALSGKGVEEAFNSLTRQVHAKQQAELELRRGKNKQKNSGFSLGGGGSGAGGGGGGCC